MKYPIKTKKYLHFLILALSILLIVNIIRLYNWARLRDVSAQIVLALNKDNRIWFLSHDAIGISGFYCQKWDKRKECIEISNQYKPLLKRIPNDIYIYRCEGKIIRTFFYSFYEVHSDDSLREAGIRLNNPQNGWLRYYHWPKSQDDNPCYPWDNLEDYWKRYGKASPEEIQAVINGSGDEK